MLSPSAKPRQLSSTPHTHRASVLSAISQKTHSITAQIQHLKIEGQRRRDIIQNAPGSGQSRLDWINQQLNQA